MILVSVTFLRIYKHKRLPQFNSLLIAISYIVYTISQIIRPFIMTLNVEYTWISEIIETLTWLLMGLSFIIKPRFTIPQTKQILV